MHLLRYFLNLNPYYCRNIKFLIKQMKNIIIKSSLIAIMSIFFVGINAQTILYTMPEEIAQHEGTWLQWPHNHTYPPFWREDLEPT